MTDRLDQLSPVKREAYRRLRARPAAAISPLVTLREGSGPVGLVLVHPVGGALLCYVPLLERLPAGVPVVGFAGDTPVEDLPVSGRIAGLAGRYLAALAEHDAEQVTWLFAGWSFGGAVAYEMGRLAVPGTPVVMLDTDPHGRDGDHQPDEATIRWYFVHDLARLIGAPESAMAAARAVVRVSTSLAEPLTRLGLEIDLTEAELADRYRVFAANARALAAYRPGRNDGPVAWVRSPRPVGVPNAWQPYCRAVRVHEVPGADHYTLLLAEHVDVAARVIVEALDAYARSH